MNNYNHDFYPGSPEDPNREEHRRRNSPSRFSAILFPCIFLGFSLFWTVSALSLGGGLFGLFGLPFIFVGISLLVSAIRGRRHSASPDSESLPETEGPMEMEGPEEPEEPETVTYMVPKNNSKLGGMLSSIFLIIFSCAFILFSVVWIIAALKSGMGLFWLFGLPFLITGVSLLIGTLKGLRRKKHIDDCCQPGDYSSMDPAQREYYEQYDAYQHTTYYNDAEISSRSSNRCPHCGKKIKRGYDYCPKCGSRLL